jgi:hypothetical protein
MTVRLQLHERNLYRIKNTSETQRNVLNNYLFYCIGQLWNAYKILVENPEGKRPLTINRRGWDNKTKMDFN